MKTFTRYDAEHHDPATRYVLAEEAERLQRLADTLTRELEAAHQHLRELSYPVENPANPLLTIESGGIRYVLEVFSDEDGDWFEVKSATPTEPLSVEAFATSADGQSSSTQERAREAMRQWRADQQRDDEESRGV